MDCRWHPVKQGLAAVLWGSIRGHIMGTPSVRPWGRRKSLYILGMGLNLILI